MPQFWISSVKLLLWYFFCISFLFTSILWNVFSHDFGMSVFKMPSKAWFTMHCKFCSSKVSKTAILKLVIFFTNLKHLLRYSRGSNCVLNFNRAPSTAVILPISYRYHCWACPYSIQNCSASSRAGSWVDECWLAILLALHVLYCQSPKLYQ